MSALIPPTGEQLNAFLKQLGCTQKNAAKYAGCTERHFRRFLKGELIMNAAQWAGMKRALLERRALIHQGKEKHF